MKYSCQNTVNVCNWLSSHLDMAAMSWLRDTENLEATVGAFFLVDVAAVEEEEAPGSSLENRAEMNWIEVGWKEGQCLISSSNGYLLNYWKVKDPSFLLGIAMRLQGGPHQSAQFYSYVRTFVWLPCNKSSRSGLSISLFLSKNLFTCNEHRIHM